MPRTMSDHIWLHWTEVSSIGSNGKQRVVCRYCQRHEQLKNAPKCKKHTVNCNKTPISIRNRFREELNAKQINQFYNHKEIKALRETDDSIHASEDSQIHQQEVGVDPQAYQYITQTSNVELVPMVKHFPHSFVKRKRDNDSESQTANSIVKYIDTFHRVKEDIDYLLNETTEDRKREFLSYALEVIAESISEEDKQYLNE